MSAFQHIGLFPGLKTWTKKWNGQHQAFQIMTILAISSPFAAKLLKLNV